jgi:hypothetical protein
MCDYPEHGCPLPALAPELARSDPAMKAQIVEELVKDRDRMLPFMPGRCATDKERAFFAIFFNHDRSKGPQPHPSCSGASPGLRALLIFFCATLIIHGQPHEPLPQLSLTD